MVRKPDGSLRPCGDYLQLNLATEDNQYLILHLKDFAGTLDGKNSFSVLDLVKGYHQIPVAPEDIPKTVIVTLFGLFEWLRMQF